MGDLIMRLPKKDIKSSNIKNINDIAKININDTIDGIPSY